MRRPSLPYELLASFARMRAERAAELSLGTRRLVMQRPYTHVEPRTEISDHALATGNLSAWRQVLGLDAADPRDPTQVPDPMKDDVKDSNPAPSDFNDDGEDEDGFDDDGEDDSDED